ncbi:MAG: hypothetical protein PUA56_06610 [Bacillales bacterium]|nr:hypothetical protein [Bacillales bacterium]
MKINKVILCFILGFALVSCDAMIPIIGASSDNTPSTSVDSQNSDTNQETSSNDITEVTSDENSK